MNSTFASARIDRLVYFLLSFSVPGIDEDLLIEFNDSGLSRIDCDVIKIAKKHSDVLTEKTGVESSLTESDIKEYMAMVMEEIHKS